MLRIYMTRWNWYRMGASKFFNFQSWAIARADGAEVELLDCFERKNLLDSGNRSREFASNWKKIQMLRFFFSFLS